MEGDKIFKKTCETCGKEIVSLSESQCEYNYNAHKLSCDMKTSKNKVNTKQIKVNQC